MMIAYVNNNNNNTNATSKKPEVRTRAPASAAIIRSAGGGSLRPVARDVVLKKETTSEENEQSEERDAVSRRFERGHPLTTWISVVLAVGCGLFGAAIVVLIERSASSGATSMAATPPPPTTASEVSLSLVRVPAPSSPPSSPSSTSREATPPTVSDAITVGVIRRAGAARDSKQKLGSRSRSRSTASVIVRDYPSDQQTTTRTLASAGQKATRVQQGQKPAGVADRENRDDGEAAAAAAVLTRAQNERSIAD